MRLAEFILREMESILGEWEAFAVDKIPAAADMKPLALRDHAQQVLEAVCADLAQPQTENEQTLKSKGDAPSLADTGVTAAQTHAILRLRSGFDLSQMVSEYRALRASVLRLWAKAAAPRETDLQDTIRFNEAIDQALAESVQSFSTEIDDAHERLARRESTNRLLLDLNAALLPLSDTGAVLKRAAKMLGEHLEVDRCVWNEFDAGQDGFTFEDHYRRDGMSALAGHSRLADLGDSQAEALRTGQPLRVDDVDDVDDVDSKSCSAEQRSACRANGVVAELSVLLMRDGRLLAGLALQQRVPRRWNDDEAALARTVLHRCWEALERIRSRAALDDSNTRLRFVLDSASIGDWELDLASGGMARSLRHDRCFGYDGLQAEWSFDTFVRHVHPEDRDDVVRRFHAAIAESTDWRVECRVVWPDASVHWLSVHGTLSFDADKPRRLLGIVTDTTRQRLDEQARLESRQLQAENLQIQESSRLKSQFLANMSHELRTPLNAVIGFADLLLAGAVDPGSPKHQQFLGHIATSGRHLLGLINDVLDLSKIESGKFEFFPEPVALPLLVNGVIDVLHTAIQAKGIGVAVDIDPALGDVVLDPARLKQVLYNYLSNAIKFTGKAGHVTVRACAQGSQQFRLEVEDTGIGIAPDDLKRLFTDFQQLDVGSTKQHQGTGLGLALTRRLVEAQGGQVGVRSVVGEGSVFFLLLDRNREGTAGDGASASPVIAGSGGRLLVIEHDPSDRTHLVDALADAGFQVDTAATAEQAVRQARGRAYDAITLALLLPDQRGLGALASIRSDGPSRDSPVVCVSMPADSGAAATFAITNVLSKPIRTEEIISAMSRFRFPEPRRANVLVIDDDPLALDLMQAALKGMGVDAVCQSDGRVAIRDIEQHRPDAIILDLMMPEFDGFAVLDALRQMPGWRDTPVFIWTSMILTPEEYASLSRTARSIVSKGGGELADMLDALRRWRPPVALMPDGVRA